MASTDASKKPFDIAIVGGGISGLTLAIALSEANIPVTIYEAAKHFGEIGAGVEDRLHRVTGHSNHGAAKSRGREITKGERRRGYGRPPARASPPAADGGAGGLAGA